MSREAKQQFRALRPTQSLSDQVTRELSAMVTGGVLQVGAMLPSEGQMAKDFGVSRTVVREAVSRLKADGLLSSQQGRGVFVAATRPTRGFAIAADAGEGLHDLLPIVELRLGVEAEAAALAALRRRESDLTAMREAQARMEAAVARGEVAGSVEADMAFHRAVCEATGNSHYTALFQYLSGHLLELISAGRRRSVAQRRVRFDPLAEHAAILAAIVDGDPEAARAAARGHVENTMRRLSEPADSDADADAADAGDAPADLEALS